MTKLVKRLSRGGAPSAGGGANSKSPGGAPKKSAQPEKKSKNSSWKDDFNKEKHKWKGRAGKAVKARKEAKQPGTERARELTVAEVAKMMAPVIQPVRAKYSGQGFAKPSCFLELRDANFRERLTQLYDEHVDGFSGKSFQKMGNAHDNMLWRQRLKAKAEADGTAVVAKRKKKRRRSRDGDDDGDDDGGEEAGGGLGGSGGGGGEKRWKRKDASGGGGGDEPWMGATTTDPASGGGGGGGGGGSSRKRKTLAARTGSSEDAFSKTQTTAKVKVEVDEKVRDGAIAAYRAMQRAKLSKQNARGRR
jgi:hypothetical protein